MQKPENNQELWSFISAHFGIDLPWRSYTKGHSSPFGFIAAGFFNPERDIAAWSSRSGGKTLDASILARLEHLFIPGLQGRVLSGSKDQALNMYAYWGDWARLIAPQQVLGDIQIGRTRINGGKLEILTASQKSVRGPKIQRLYNDEVDEIEPELLEAALPMLASKVVGGKKVIARAIYASTWHRTDGAMGRLVDNTPDNGVELHKWNAWECVSQCGEERHEHGKNCAECPLGVDCLKARVDYELANGRMPDGKPGIASEPLGIFAIEDAIKLWRNLSRATIDAECLCLRPNPAGMVYPAFDVIKHRIPKAPDDLAIYRAIDWGYRAFVCLWIGLAKNGTVYVLDTYQAEDGTLKTHADYLNAHHMKAEGTYCDPAGRQKNDQTGHSNVEEFGKFGIRCEYRLDKRSVDVANGIKLVTNYLDPASGPPRLYVVDTPANRMFIKAMQGYENMKVNNVYIDKPKDPQEFEHIPDALRYFFVNKTQGSQGGVVRIGVS